MYHRTFISVTFRTFSHILFNFKEAILESNIDTTNYGDGSIGTDIIVRMGSLPKQGTDLEHLSIGEVTAWGWI